MSISASALLIVFKAQVMSFGRNSDSLLEVRERELNKNTHTHTHKVLCIHLGKQAVYFK